VAVIRQIKNLIIDNIYHASGCLCDYFTHAKRQMEGTYIVMVGLASPTGRRKKASTEKAIPFWQVISNQVRH
jgi:hypothetical protein